MVNLRKSARERGSNGSEEWGKQDEKGLGVGISHSDARCSVMTDMVGVRNEEGHRILSYRQSEK